jgi:quercetin dioxygenase-like cupin family protein
MDRGKYFISAEKVEAYIPPGHSGTVNRRLIGKETVGAGNFEVILGELEPGGAAHRHSHPHSEHGYYILEGKCHVEVAGVRQEVSQGMAVFVPRGVEHELTVLEPLKILIFYAPPLEHLTVGNT